ncbi:MAG: phosphatidylinositol alpha-mannosyltransferase [Dehalococcoidales bacterium]|nr:phosphatidylinositol alpha-mannosyltransferase [Dehalococcoidales bacterium]
MKIALVSPYDFVYPGGVANHITNLDRNLTRMGHDVRIIAPASRTVSTFGDRFIPIGKPRSIPTSGSVCRITLSLRLASTIKAVLSREKFDIVHLHEPFMPMLCSAVLRFSDTVNIGTFHACDGSPGYNLGWPVSLIIARRRARNLDGRIAVSKPAMEFASKYIPGAYEIIPNGVDLQHFSPEVTPIEEFGDGKQNILFLGRLERRKGLIYLLRAFKQVKETIPNSRLIVVGPGTALRRVYERWIRINKLQDVVFVGYVPYDQLPRYYQTADIFCAPALSRESFGIVLIEAMAMGKPIIASNIKGYASVLTHDQEGLLVPPKNSQELARALLSLLGDSARRQQMGTKGKLNAREYSWEKVAGRVVDYYTRVIGNSSPKKDNQ